MIQTTPAQVLESLRKAQHVLRLAVDGALRELHLTAAQYAALRAIAETTGISGATLARRCFVTPQTMTGIVANLTTAGLVQRTPDPEHGRILRVRLTPQGADLQRRAQHVVQAIEERMVGDLDRAEREALADLLAQCASALATS